MEINVELFKQYYGIVEQKLKEVGKLKYCPKEYKEFDYIHVENNKVYLIEHCWDYNDNKEIPDYIFSKSLEEIQEIFDEKYGEYVRSEERREQVMKERQERKQYEYLKAKFEK